MRINTESPAEASEVIYQVLTSRRFEKWYDNGAFTDHITGELDCKSKEEILKDIVDMFSINN